MMKKMNIKKFIERKFLGIAFVFLLLGLSMIMAGNVIVDDGALDVEEDFTVNPSVLYVDSANVGIGKIPVEELDVNGNIKVSSGNDIFIEGGNRLSSFVGGDIMRVYESETTPLTFTGCESGDCSIGIDVDGVGVCDDAGAACASGHTHLVGDTDISAGAIEGGLGGEIQDNTITDDDLAPNSTNNSELVDQIIVPGGIRVGSDQRNSEIFHSTVGASSSNSLFIGNKKIVTEGRDKDTKYTLVTDKIGQSTTFAAGAVLRSISVQCRTGYKIMGCSSWISYKKGNIGSRQENNGCIAFGYVTDPGDYTLIVYAYCAKLEPI
jgi:hypothetical protein